MTITLNQLCNQLKEIPLHSWSRDPPYEETFPKEKSSGKYVITYQANKDKFSLELRQSYSWYYSEERQSEEGFTMGGNLSFFGDKYFLKLTSSGKNVTFSEDCGMGYLSDLFCFLEKKVLPITSKKYEKEQESKKKLKEKEKKRDLDKRRDLASRILSGKVKSRS